MNYLIDKYIETDFNTEFLINYLKDDDYIASNRNEVEFRISELTYPQFLYVLNSVIESSYKKQLHEMTLSKENLEMFFEFIYDFNQRHLKHLRFKSYNDIHLKILGLKNHDDKTRIFVKQYDNRVNVLIKELISKLSFKSKYFMKNEVVDVIYSYPENLIGRTCKIPLIDFIINKLNEIRCYYENGYYSFSTFLIDKPSKSEKRINRNVFEIEESFLKQLYERFRMKEFIDEGVSYDNFHKAIVFEENDPNVKVVFNLKGTEFKHFFDLLQNISEQKVYFKPFIENNNMILNKKKNRYNYITLKDYGRSNSEIAEDIDDIFNEIS